MWDARGDFFSLLFFPHLFFYFILFYFFFYLFFFFFSFKKFFLPARVLSKEHKGKRIRRVC